MKIKCFKTISRTTCVEIEVDDNTPSDEYQTEAELIEHLHGCSVVSETEDFWYVAEDKDGIPKFGNPLNM